MSGAISDLASDFTSHAITDIGDTYQEVLLQDSGISPPDGIGVQEREIITETIEPDTGGVELESYGAEPEGPIAGLDIA